MNSPTATTVRTASSPATRAVPVTQSRWLDSAEHPFARSIPMACGAVSIPPVKRVHSAGDAGDAPFPTRSTSVDDVPHRPRKPRWGLVELVQLAHVSAALRPVCRVPDQYVPGEDEKPPPCSSTYSVVRGDVLRFA